VNRDIAVELFVPKDRLAANALAVVLDALVGVGFEEETAPGRGVSYGDGWNLFESARLSDALDYYQRSMSDEPPNDFQRRYGLSWGIDLWKRTTDDRVEVHLGISAAENPRQAASGLLRVHLSTPLDWQPRRIREKSDAPNHLPREFLAWSRFLADLTRPIYGWGGYGGVGLWGETTPIASSAIAATDLPAIEWLNVFGGPYIERIGAERILSAPAWRAEFLANGGLIVVLGAHPRAVPADQAKEVARHLGIPPR
jgi:hypothetical protein